MNMNRLRVPCRQAVSYLSGWPGRPQDGFAHIRQQLSRGPSKHTTHAVRGHTSIASSMEATKSALTSGMHHSFFCHGLSSFFSDVCECLRVIWSPPDSTALSDESQRWSCPSGALLQARAIRCASPFSSSLGGLPGRGRSTTAPCSLLRTPFDTIQYLDTSSASAIRCTVQPSSAFSKIWQPLARTRAPSDELLQRLPRIIKLDHIAFQYPPYESEFIRVYQFLYLYKTRLTD